MPGKKSSTPAIDTATLAEQLVRVLESQRRLGGEAYPVSYPQLRELTGMADKVMKAALTSAPFTGQAVTTVDKPRSIYFTGTNNLIALKGDLGVLLQDDRLLLFALQRSRTKRSHAHTIDILKKKLPVPLQAPFAEALKRRLTNGELPPGVAWILHNSPRLFLLTDLQPTASPPRQADQPASASAPPTAPAAAAPGDFANAFRTAFDQLYRQSGRRNFVNLLDLRNALASYSREAFDSGLHTLRLSGEFDLSAAGGREQLSPEEQQAGIQEGNALLLYASRID